MCYNFQLQSKTRFSKKKNKKKKFKCISKDNNILLCIIHLIYGTSFFESERVR